MDLSIKCEPPEDGSDGRYVWIEVPDVKTISIKHEPEERSSDEEPVECEPQEEHSGDEVYNIKTFIEHKPGVEKCSVDEGDVKTYNGKHLAKKIEQIANVYHGNSDESTNESLNYLKQGLIPSILNQETYAEEPIDTQITHKRKREKKFECDICMKKFNRSSNLNRHRRAHTGEKHFECNVCMKKFGQLHHLNRHVGIHSGEKPFECDICTRKFGQLHHLRRHKQTHGGEKPYECDVCFKKLSRPSTLKDHKRTHSGEKLFECDICLKKLTTLSNLNEHKRIHSGYKPFHCNFCIKKFRQLSDMKRHILTHVKKKKELAKDKEEPPCV